MQQPKPAQLQRLHAAWIEISFNNLPEHYYPLNAECRPDKDARNSVVLIITQLQMPEKRQRRTPDNHYRHKQFLSDRRYSPGVFNHVPRRGESTQVSLPPLNAPTYFSGYSNVTLERSNNKRPAYTQVLSTHFNDPTLCFSTVCCKQTRSYRVYKQLKRRRTERLVINEWD